jgi:hypothetical protein
MNIIQNFLTQNDCYRAGKTITVKGLMLHSVGCSQPNASVFLKNWNRSGVEACVHGFIDGNTGTVYQTLPWNHRGWHGGGKSNNTHIGVEMCEPASIKYTGGSSFKDTDPVATKKVVLRTYNAAVELFAFLCKEYKLNPLTDIVSHREGHALGIASNHGDPEHLWKVFGLSMDGFRKAVKAQMDKGEGNTPSKTENGTQGVSVPYKVRITDEVDVHSAPAVTQVKTKGVYTIVEEKNGYGKLKSGAGWIKLSEVKKV